MGAILSFVGLRGILIAAALVAGGAFLWRMDNMIWQRGYDARAAEEARIMKEKTDAANAADDAARRCSADPACRLSNDGFRRD